ncbi:LysR family transcriptional regulator [Conservatibacter flavescens]|uniref:LysR family transcriptional regulator n=1 Tax=Conservatibacter flavescens TaxID=28161 RepID=A0A2M8S0W5_9PAST|nr:LysR family transcriptional regulator [Conservatibacter flavescens]PJG84790.1 LysR family transcriptional regulator [Conservatibacter flavescens]
MKENLNDLRTFLVVARTGSFTKAGAQLGVSQSAVSYAIRGIEERLKIKLFHRTTRSISTTEAGEQLYQRLLPLFEGIDREIDELGTFLGELRGTLRINATELTFSVLWEKFDRFLNAYPSVNLELSGDTRFIDIVAEQFDASIRLGSDVEKDMIAVRISDDLAMCTVASPAYLAQYGEPKTPEELANHQCLQLRLPINGGILDWAFTDPTSQETVKIQPQGRFIANTNSILINACLSGVGVMWMPYHLVEDHIASGELVPILREWNKHYEGFHLYYPNRRENSPLLKALVESLRG